MTLSRFVVFSSVCHFLLVGSNSFIGLFYSKPQFTVQTAPTSVDVTLVEELKVEPRKEEIVEIKEDTPGILIPKEEIQIPPKEESPKPVPVDSLRGAITETTPNYIKNPAPPYPLKARQNGWQGVVVLKVLVSVAGQSLQVEVEKSSGYSVLDEAAIKTVKIWRFRPAEIGNIPIESLVRVPIRFILES